VAIQGATLEPKISRSVADDCSDADHLGIVLVHGVGFQNPGETLLSWSDRLIRMLNSRYGSNEVTPSDLVYRSAVDLHGGRQSSIELRIPAGEGRARQQHWLLTEAYWAASFQPPSVPTILAWLGARGAAALAARGFKPLNRLRNGVYLTGIVIGVLLVYAAIRVVTSIIPITAVRNALVAPLDRLLTGWSGDMHVLLFDPAQSANIRTRVREAMQALAEAGFPRLAVVAHSGGAVASYMTLTDSALWAAQDPAANPVPVPSVLSYVTLGQGLNVAWRLCGVGDGQSCDRASGSGRRLTQDVRANHPQLRWNYFHSEGDTVAEASVSPPECLLEAGPHLPDEHPIENKPSNPHGTYWDNDEEFLLPVIHRLLAAGRTDPPAADQPAPEFPEPSPSWLESRLLRIGMFSLTSRVLFSAMVTAILGSALLGGGRLEDLGNWVAAIADDIPGNELVTGPLGWLRDASRAEGHSWAREAGTYLVTLILLLAAVYPLLRLAPRKLAWERERLRRLGPLVRTVDVGAAFLPLVPILAWALPLGRGPDPTRAPDLPVIVGLIVVAIGLGVAYVVFSRQDPERPAAARGPTSSRWSGVIAMGLLVVVGVATFSTVVALAGDTAYGATSLGVAAIGALAVWLLFKLLARLANWRWDAWDDQEREQFRQSKGGEEPDAAERRPFGRQVDLLVIGLIGAAAMTLALAVGGPFIRDAAAMQAFGVVGGVVLLVGVVGAGQDAANSRAGVKPQEMTPLPSSAA
jgi:hypothetical protein